MKHSYNKIYGNGLTICFLLLFLITSPIIVNAQSSTQEDILIHSCEENYTYRRFAQANVSTAKLLRLAETTGSESAKVYGTAYHTLCVVSAGDTTNISSDIDYLVKESKVLEKESNLPQLLVVSKALSLYYNLIEQDFSLSSAYAFKTLDSSRKIKNDREEVDALAALASIYFLKNDSTGMSYAVSCYNKTKAINYDAGLYRASCNMANYIYNRLDFTNALRYLQDAKKIADRLHFDCEQQYLNSFLGDVYHRLGKDAEAEKWYKLSVIDKDVTSYYDRLYARLCYAMFLTDMGRTEEAIRMYRELESSTAKYGVHTFDLPLYSQISKLYETTGDAQNALAYYKKYMEENQRIVTAEKEKEFSILNLKNSVSEEKEKNAAQKVELLEKEKKLSILILISIIAMILIVFLLVYNRAKNRQYKAIVQIHLDNIKKEQLQQEINQQRDNAAQRENVTDDSISTASDDAREKYSNSSLTDDKGIELFNKIEHVMKHDKVYHDSSLSIDKLASIVLTNRSYLSQVINKYAECSYSTYVNNFRLNEAMKVLADVNNKESLKIIATQIGFNSASSFYQLFKDRTGVSPSIYRDQCCRLQNDAQNHK